jgi:NTE family protein
MFPLNPVTGLFGLLGAREHLISDSGLRQLLAPYLQCEALEQTATALHVVAVDVLRSEELLSRGPLLDAVLASAAIPGLLPSVAWEAHTLIDGGVANNTPLSHAVALGAQRIYVLPAGHACAPSPDRRHRAPPWRRRADRPPLPLSAARPADRLRSCRRADRAIAAGRPRVPRPPRSR